MPDFTELHLHLLPGVDDGPQSDEESLDLARQLVASSVTRCVVTPHFNAWNPNLLANLDEVKAAVTELNTLLADNAINLEVHPGAEHFLTPELIDLVQKGAAPLLGPGPYILVEFPFDNRPLYADDLLYQLGLLGLIPVLAHPARYAWVQTNPDAVEKLVDGGVHLQLTAGSLSGQYGPRVKRTAEHILHRGWYSLPGSDIHHPGQPRSLADMYETVMSLGDEATAQLLLVENPRRVLTGEPLLPVPPIEFNDPPKRRFRLFGE